MVIVVNLYRVIVTLSTTAQLKKELQAKKTVRLCRKTLYHKPIRHTPYTACQSTFYCPTNSGAEAPVLKDIAANIIHIKNKITLLTHQYKVAGQTERWMQMDTLTTKIQELEKTKAQLEQSYDSYQKESSQEKVPNGQRP